MFCFQCEQTANGKGCVTAGVCGKNPEIAQKQDLLTGALISLARVAKNPAQSTDDLLMLGMFATLTNVNFDGTSLDDLIDQVHRAKDSFGIEADFPAENLWVGDPDVLSLRSTLLLGLRGVAAYAWHARTLGRTNPEVTAALYQGLRDLVEKHTVEQWLGLLLDLGQTNLKVMALLDEANTTTYGHPTPTPVTTVVEKGPFIVVTGHDLLDLQQLLEQTAGKGINIYTHGEMLPAHSYPELKKYPHLKGNYGTAWQSQQKEFAEIPAPILFTSNCLMPVKDSYRDRVFTTGPVSFPGVAYIPADANHKKDFSQVLECALKLGGWPEDKKLTGMNGGTNLLTGFGRNTVLGVADKIIDGVKSGAIKHFFLVGGCDGARPSRNYFNDFVKQTPPDTIILTLACGKYRFNDLDLGDIGGIPRILDMGQCNDAYSAIMVAVALAEAFECSVNQLPLTLVVSWYEQKAVSILLTLLSLGIKNIYLGPTLPAFISPNVLDVLVKQFQLKAISTPEQDLQAILGK